MTESLPQGLTNGQLQAELPSDHAIAPRKSVATYEIKFLVDPDLAERLLAAARESLPADPHCESHLGDAYRINSLYLDTRDLAIFQRRGPRLSRKYRLRRYGAESMVFLERKTKRQSVVRKRRVQIGSSEPSQLNAVEVNDSWEGSWFHREILSRQLVPQVQLSYCRVARVAETDAGPIRFTVDSHLRCTQRSEFALAECGNGQSLLCDERIVEFKFRHAMPILFKQMMAEFRLISVPISKYRLAMQVLSGPARSNTVSLNDLASEVS